MKIFNFRVIFAGCAGLVSSQAIAACYNSFGPIVFYQKVTTGDLVYTLSTGGPSEDRFIPWTKLILHTPPKNGTSLALTTHSEGNGPVGAAIFYLSAANFIMQVRILYDQSNGKAIEQQGPWTISTEVSTGLDESTGLAASYRNRSDGDRVFYHDSFGTTQMIRYSHPKNIRWGLNTSVLSPTAHYSNAIATDSGINQTTYSIDNTGKIVSATLDDNEQWTATTGSPSDLPAWYPANVSLVATSSLNSSTKTLYYIGIDRALHKVVSSDGGRTWVVGTSQPDEHWPLSDEPNAPFAYASPDQSGEKSSFFYVSGGNLVKLNNHNDVWTKSKVLLRYVNSPSNDDASDNGKTKMVNIGTGVGLGVGIPIVIAIATTVILLRRRKKAALTANDTPESQHVVPDMVAFKEEIDGKDKIVHEISGKDKVIHEIHGKPVLPELEGGSLMIHELDSPSKTAEPLNDSKAY